MQRGFDSIIHDIALQRLPVLMCIDRAGINSRDGVTHGGLFDVAFLSGLPGVRIYTPATYEALGRAIYEALESNCPSAVRYPAGAENPIIIGEFYAQNIPGEPRGGEDESYPYVVAGRSMPENPEVVIISHGRIAAEAVRAAGMLRERYIPAGAILLERLTPYDKTAEALEKILRRGKQPKKIVFLEEEIRAGGMGMLLSDALGRRGGFPGSDFIIIALEDPFERQKDSRPVFESYGLDAASVMEKIMSGG